MECEAIVSRVVLSFFSLLEGGERVIHCGTDELRELIEIYWL